MTHPFNLAQQRKLLKSLGFGFVETALPATSTEEAPRQPVPRPTAPIPAPARRPQSGAPRPSAPPPPPAPPLAVGLGFAAITDRTTEEVLADVASAVASCARCGLHQQRRLPMAGEGSPRARVIFIGEMPLPEDEAAGKSYQGEIGEMLQKMIGAMKLKPEECFYTTAVKCRSLTSRPAMDEDLSACSPWLQQQIAAIQPEAVICFGTQALQSLAPELAQQGLASLRGRWIMAGNIAIMPTFSLTYIHRNNERKRVVWGDMQEVMKRLGV